MDCGVAGASLRAAKVFNVGSILLVRYRSYAKILAKTISSVTSFIFWSLVLWLTESCFPLTLTIHLMCACLTLEHSRDYQRC